MDKFKYWMVLLPALAMWLMPLPVRAGAGDAAGAALRVVVNGKTLHDIPAGFVQGHTPYVPLRPICGALGGRVRWDPENQQAQVEYNRRRYPVKGILQDDCLIVTMDTFSKIFNVNAVYDLVFSAVLLDAGKTPAQTELPDILPQFNGYTREDLHWLSRIVEAEATGETYASRLAVASVILNRLQDKSYPNTVKEVIFDHKHGVQFTPTINGSVFNHPSALSFLAALDALEGRNNAPGALFFMNPRYATSFWIEKNRQFAFTIGGHSYYY